MYKPFKIIPFLSWIFILSCSSEDPTGPGNNTPQPVLTRIVAVGNSLTAGVQSGGLVDDFQLNSYPYLIATQAGKAGDFQQPLISAPGVGEIDSASGLAYGPLKYQEGQIVQGDPVPGGVDGIVNLLSNALLPRAYDNLGLPGADVKDILTATGGGIYDLVLRNPYFGNTTAVEQTKSLSPTLIFLWAGNNDVLGAALDGGNASLITPLPEFRSDYTSILDELNSINDSSVVLIVANIPNVSDIPYVNLLDDLIYRPVPEIGLNTAVPVMFDTSFQPILFDTIYVPLLTEENRVEINHVLLPFLAEYSENGLGIPDSAALVNMGFSTEQASIIIQQFMASNLQVSGNPIPAYMTLTNSEKVNIENAVAGFNQVILELTQARNIPLVDANAVLNQLNNSGMDGYSGKFVYFDVENTAFSLDGIHPNDGGYAIIANEFIKVMNQFPDVDIPLLNTADFKGQYSGMQTKNITRKAAEQARSFFVK